MKDGRAGRAREGEKLGIALKGRGAFSQSITIYFRAPVAPLFRGRNLSVILVSNPTLRGFFRFEIPYESGFLVVNTTGDPANPNTDLWTGLTDERCEELVRVAELLCANSGRERTSVIVYALGWTQHTTGVQMIRTAGILQLLLGNMGRPGGGIMAMRGHSTIQGSTDLATLYDSLPGYLPQPTVAKQHETLDSYVEQAGLKTGFWANFRKFIVSLLKAWYGDSATPDNDFRFSWLPRIDGDYSDLAYFDRMPARFSSNNLRSTN